MHSFLLQLPALLFYGKTETVVVSAHQIPCFRIAQPILRCIHMLTQVYELNFTK